MCARWLAAACAVAMPTAVDPVKVILWTSGCAVSAAPAFAPSPVSIWIAPSVTPASIIRSTSLHSVSGFWCGGFTMAALPAISDGATFWSNRSHGKLNGMMHATTPIGSRRVMQMVVSCPASSPLGMTSL